jgi:hypothetical protein
MYLAKMNRITSIYVYDSIESRINSKWSIWEGNTERRPRVHQMLKKTTDARCQNGPRIMI